jgi:hypothetical protein
VVLAVVLTLIAWNALSFGWFGLPSLGFVTAGGAHELAVARMEKVAVPLAAQLCVLRFNEQVPAVVIEKRGKLKEATYTHAMGEQLDKSWVRLGDSPDTNGRVIEACAKLILAAPTDKSAELTK